MRRAVCPGSFDPVTNGHLDIVERAAALFDEVVLAVLVNDAKAGVFSIDERLDLLGSAIKERGLDNVRVESFRGLLVDFCRDQEAVAIVKGLRSSTDFDYELPMAHMNSHLSGIETVLLATSPQWSFVSSSLVKDVARSGGDIAGLVPKDVAAPLTERLAAARSLRDG